MKRAAKVVMSHGPADKVMACLNRDSTATDYRRARAYFDACARWWSLLSPEHREVALAVVDAYAGPHQSAAEELAASLPPAPKCPDL